MRNFLVAWETEAKGVAVTYFSWEFDVAAVFLCLTLPNNSAKKRDADTHTQEENISNRILMNITEETEFLFVHSNLVGFLVINKMIFTPEPV